MINLLLQFDVREEGKELFIALERIKPEVRLEQEELLNYMVSALGTVCFQIQDDKKASDRLKSKANQLEAALSTIFSATFKSPNKK